MTSTLEDVDVERLLADVSPPTCQMLIGGVPCGAPAVVFAKPVPCGHGLAYFCGEHQVIIVGLVAHLRRKHGAVGCEHCHQIITDIEWIQL